MIKRFFTSVIIAIALIGVVGLYGEYLRSHRPPQAKSNAKALQTSITFIEGWSNNDIAQYLEKENVTSAESFLSSAKNFDVSVYSDLAEKPANADLEGYIFPDTYFIPKDVPTSTNISNIILTKALNNFEQKVTPEMVAQAKANNLNFYQALTLASIIEKESNGQDSDRKTIAGIFYNRLSAGMPLQSDATVNFITNKKTPSITQEDTLIDSPYNTYKYVGLPPGPICNPSLGSIMAALYPEKSSYLYFLTDPATGRAVFATTYEEHLANKQKYLK